MLVHKKSLGVLEQAPWDGESMLVIANGTKIPKLRPATLAGLGLDPAEWWEVPSRSHLAKLIRWSYPFFIPEVDEEGELVGVVPWAKWQVYGEAEPEEEIMRVPPAGGRRKRRRRKQIC